MSHPLSVIPATPPVTTSLPFSFSCGMCITMDDAHRQTVLCNESKSFQGQLPDTKGVDGWQLMVSYRTFEGAEEAAQPVAARRYRSFFFPFIAACPCFGRNHKLAGLHASRNEVGGLESTNFTWLHSQYQHQCPSPHTTLAIFHLRTIMLVRFDRHWHVGLCFADTWLRSLRCGQRSSSPPYSLSVSCSVDHGYV
jgi:hypothetical protein